MSYGLETRAPLLDHKIVDLHGHYQAILEFKIILVKDFKGNSI